jgi:mannose-6-phosphate isomerase class I
VLVHNPLFTVEEWQLSSGARAQLQSRRMQIIACVNGKLRVADGNAAVDLSPGQFCLVPACLERTKIFADAAASLLRAEAN